MFTPRRSRLSLVAVPPATLTLSHDGTVNHEYEDFILMDKVENVPFTHWTAHLRYFWGWYSEEPNFACAESDFPSLRETIADGLRRAGYFELATDISTATDETTLNRHIITQYTDENNLYGETSQLLREAHIGSIIRDHPLSAWILQFNAALRMLTEFDGTVYRGARMTESDIDMYQTDLMFVWASFVSASKDRNVALDYRGNVLFNITPWGSYSMYGKRNPFDISHQSIFPEEQEVVFPIACTYRVTNRQKDGNRILISLETVDQY